MTTTVQNVYDVFSRYKKNITDVSNALFLDWCDEVNRFAYRIIYATDAGRFITQSTINVTSGLATYSLPADFENMEVLGTGIFTTNNSASSPTDYRLPKTGYGSNLTGYYIQGTTIHLTPTPGATATLVINYIPTITALTSFTDSMVVPSEFLYYVKYAVDCQYDMWDEDTNAEGLADQRFIRALDELCRNINKDSRTVGLNTYAGTYYAPTTNTN